MVSTSSRPFLGPDNNVGTEELPLELLHLELVANVLRCPTGSPEKEKALADLVIILRQFNGYNLAKGLILDP
jgi:hypothetical protein